MTLCRMMLLIGFMGSPPRPGWSCLGSPAARCSIAPGWPKAKRLAGRCQYARLAGPAGRRAASVRALGTVDQAPQAPEAGEHVSVRVGRVTSARVRQDDELGAGKRTSEDFVAAPPVPRLRFRPNPSGRAQHGEQAHAEHRDDRRPKPPNDPSQAPSAHGIVALGQLVNPAARSRHEVGQPVSPFRQAGIVETGEADGHEARLVQQLPEPVRVPGEVVADGGRAQAGIDPDEQHPHAEADVIREPRATAAGTGAPTSVSHLSPFTVQGQPWWPVSISCYRLATSVRSFGYSTISMRRFSALPSGVSLLASGRVYA